MGKITFIGVLLGFVNLHVDSQNLANLLGNVPVIGRFLQDIELESTFFNIPFIYNDVTQVKFILYTKLNPEVGHNLVLEDAQTFTRSYWNPSHPVKILIHGYAQSGYSKDFPKSVKDGKWQSCYIILLAKDFYKSGSEDVQEYELCFKLTLDITAAYLDYGIPRKIEGLMSNDLDEREANGTFNVICLDWSLMSKEMIYFSSAVNTEKVGQRVGQFLMYLKDNGYVLDFNAVHLIGFSLGSHVAGVAGNFVQQATNGSYAVGRITGLDPAGPGFLTVPLRLRLDPGDGDFVDVIHSNSGTVFLAQYGNPQPIGHIDFFPNGGARQPSCDASFFREFTIPRRVACNHLKSAEYFRRSIRGEVFTGCWCESWTLYQEGLCNCNEQNATAIMGEYCDHNARGRYYLYLDV